MKSKNQKKEELKALQSKLPESQITVFTSFARAGEKGLSVAQMTQLKRLLREAHSEYVVTKKTLVERVFRQAQDKPQDGVDVYSMGGSLGLVVGKDEPYGVAKKVYEFAKKNPALQFFGAVVNGAFISKEDFLEMAKMPSKEVLIGRLLGMMKYPITSLYVVMSEIAKKSGAGQPVAEAAPIVEESVPASEAAPETPTEEPSATEAPAEQSAEAPAAETTN